MDDPSMWRRLIGVVGGFRLYRELATDAPPLVTTSEVGSRDKEALPMENDATAECSVGQGVYNKGDVDGNSNGLRLREQIGRKLVIGNRQRRTRMSRWWIGLASPSSPKNLGLQKRGREG